MKVGIVLPNWIGDVVMATPTLRALRQYYGATSTLIGIARPPAADVLAGTHWLDDLILLDRRSPDRSRRFWGVAAELRRRQLDVCVLLTNSLSTAALAWLGRARRRVGFVRHGRGLLLTDRLDPPRSGGKLLPISQLDYYLQLAYAVGCPPESRRLELAVSPTDQDQADRVWRRMGWADRSPVVSFNTGGTYGEAKHWPAEHFVALAQRVIADTDAKVLILCGPSERDAARAIEQAVADPRVRSLADQPVSIGLSKACVARSQLLVTTDSGPRHFAAAFQVPVISLFGNKDPAWSETYYERAVHLKLDLPCMPCGKRSCPLGHHRCMRDLSVEMVHTEVLRQLAIVPVAAA